MNLKLIGAIIFFASLGIFVVYLLGFYIPAIQANPADADALMNAVWWGLGCGVVGTIGAALTKIGD